MFQVVDADYEMWKRDLPREVGKRHFLAENLWIRLLMKRHTKHFRAEGTEKVIS